MSRRAFALPVVLAAMVLMAMVVAVGAQRALRSMRQAGLELARVELAIAVAGGQSAGLDSVGVRACCPVIIPGALIASGEAVTGRARARWTLVGAAPPFAAMDLTAETPVYGGNARVRHRLLLAWEPDSTGLGRWVPLAGLGWTRVPSP